MTGGWRILFMISISCLLLPSHCVNRDKITYPFPINSLLTCHVPDPSNGPKASMPEPRFRVPLQPGPTGTVWRPAESRFRLPSTQKLDTNLLLEFLGNDINLFFSNTDQPRDDPVLAVGTLTVEGSGGSQRVFVDDPTEPPPGLEQFDREEERTTILRWIRDEGLGNCPLTPEWIRLPNSYFPPFFSGSKCGGQGVSCSFPAGQTCEPDVGPGRLAYVTVLRWDCCWSYINGEWRWECGWRKVDAPIIVDCLCGCQPRQRTVFK